MPRRLGKLARKERSELHATLVFYFSASFPFLFPAYSLRLSAEARLCGGEKAGPSAEDLDLEHTK